MQGITIEQFIISHKIEKIKELIIYGELTISEIAWKMNYSSVAHLSNQFKKIAGLPPSHFKQLKEKRRRPIDEIGNTNNGFVGLTEGIRWKAKKLEKPQLPLNCSVYS